MQNDSNSNARCIKAIELTFRFVLRNLVTLVFFFLASFFLFGKKSDPAVAIVFLVVALYFTVAYHHFGRGNKASLVIAILAGTSAVGTVAALHSNDDTDELNSAINPATGLMMMGGIDAMGNPYGFDMNSTGMSGNDISMCNNTHHIFDSENNLAMMDNSPDNHRSIFGDDFSTFDDSHHSFNPANGLPMTDDATDIHGNMFCTNSMDDLMGHGSSMFDDSMAHTSLDGGFNSGSFDDDWNK